MTDLTTQRQLLKSKQDELSQALSKSTAFMSLMGDFPDFRTAEFYKNRTSDEILRLLKLELERRQRQLKEQEARIHPDIFKNIESMRKKYEDPVFKNSKTINDNIDPATRLADLKVKYKDLLVYSKDNKENPNRIDEIKKKYASLIKIKEPENQIKTPESSKNGSLVKTSLLNDEIFDDKKVGISQKSDNNNQLNSPKSEAKSRQEKIASANLNSPKSDRSLDSPSNKARSKIKETFFSNNKKKVFTPSGMKIAASLMERYMMLEKCLGGGGEDINITHSKTEDLQHNNVERPELPLTRHSKKANLSKEEIEEDWNV